MAKEETTTKKIKISHARLQLEFAPSVAAIGSLENIDGADAVFNIVKTRKKIDAAIEIYTETRNKIATDLAEKGKDKKPLTRKSARYNPAVQQEQEVEVYVFKDEETEAEVNRKAQELDEKEISLEIFPIKYDAIKDCKGLKPNIILGAGEFVILE